MSKENKKTNLYVVVTGDGNDVFFQEGNSLDDALGQVIYDGSFDQGSRFRAIEIRDIPLYQIKLTAQQLKDA